ncbi:MAG: gliding motility lipoprotein GldB [Croceitalea sp.]|nr:gliding motility lipoprotein GldB [Croceitalea sp.]NNC34118.1 gliding motility lipoprotein GldB [Croceitalea sp.]
MKLNSKFFLIAVSAMLWMACKEEKKISDEVARIPVNLNLGRFDREFATANAEDIPQLKNKYPYLFPKQYTDSIWVAKLQDTLQMEIAHEVDSVFGDFNEEREDLELLFKHIKYYYPQYSIPKLVTLTNDVEYDYRVVLTDSLLLVALDNYLGSDHHFYAGIQNYIAQDLDKKYLAADVASAFAKIVNQYPKDRSFLARMIYYGKELYIKNLLLPNKEIDIIMGYSPEDMDWALANEEQIWRYYVEESLLYSTDPKLENRFLDPAPFSKFGLELDRESPSRLGRFIGWQIVNTFVEQNPSLGLSELLAMPADEIFRKSNYKPKK